MSDDYLWDGSGPPDPDVERLERMLGRLRSTAAMPELPDRSAGLSSPRIATLKGSLYVSPRFLVPALAAAASIVAMIGVTWQTIGGTRSWEVERMAGQPRIGGVGVGGAGRLRVGQTVGTDTASRPRLGVGTIG